MVYTVYKILLMPLLNIVSDEVKLIIAFLKTYVAMLKVHKIEISFGFDFEICIISLLVMSKY
jgi:hypothetical protein